MVRIRIKMQQTLPGLLRAGSDYTLTLAFGNRDLGTAQWSGYHVQLIAGYQGPNEATLIDSEVSINPAPSGELVDVSLDYAVDTVTTGVGEPLTLVVEMADPTTRPGYLDVDNARLVATRVVPIPVPASVLLALALSGVGVLRLRRKARTLVRH